MSPYDYEIDVSPLSPALGGGYVAVVPDLPGCMSDGETPEEAMANGYSAAASWIEEAKRLGREVPAPNVALKYA